MIHKRVIIQVYSIGVGNNNYIIHVVEEERAQSHTIINTAEQRELVVDPRSYR